MPPIWLLNSRSCFNTLPQSPLLEDFVGVLQQAVQIDRPAKGFLDAVLGLGQLFDSLLWDGNCYVHDLASGSVFRVGAGSCSMAGEQSFGVTFPDWLVDEVESLQEDWDEQESRSVSRSEVVREATALGVIALEQFEGQRMAHAPTREQRSMVRQAMIDFFEADDGELGE